MVTRLARKAGQKAQGVCLTLPTQYQLLGLQACSVTGFYVSDWDLNSGPHVSITYH